ncbi:MAG: hypothetical protein MJY87_11150 [Fibrobacter sp.]|nr:hypothetical protein [Fibrobacter sp.]
MSKLLAYLIPGILFDIAVMLFCKFGVSEDTFYATWFGNLIAILLISGIVIPSIIYYVKMPPGQNTKP